jgi:PilZ domain
MNTPPVQVERRVGQRFPYVLAISFRQANSVAGMAFTQDLSSRGVFFFTDAPLTEGSEIELTLCMPSEITLGESMPVRCRGHILRIVRPVASTSRVLPDDRAETKIGVAVRFEGYEYLTEPAESANTFPRVASLHPQREEDRLAHPSIRG